MKKTMFYLPDDLHRFLVEEAVSRGVSMAEVAREAIDVYRLARRRVGRGEPSQLIGIADDLELPFDWVERLDEYVLSGIGDEGQWSADFEGEGRNR